MPNCDLRQSLTSVCNDNAFYYIEHIIFQNQFFNVVFDSLKISLIQLKQNQVITIVKITGKRSFLSENNL